MLLAVDVGNTNLTIGIFDGERLAADWRIKTDLEQTADGWGALFHTLASLAGLNLRDVDGFVFASVVPQLDASICGVASRYLKLEPLQVTANTRTGLKIRVDTPQEVGADRIVNSAAAAARYGCPSIAVDFGTAITFDAISKHREYLGGIICPGIQVSAQALVRRTARLPQIELRQPAKVIGSSTVGSLQSGFYYGMLGMVDGILETMLPVLGTDATVIATGGQSESLAKDSRFIQVLHPNLTLEGLRMLWHLNRA
ncbi:MAG: type III pantothenate kinase [Bryobacterales bacterium]|nr:type III pantothenate kinase [Bryobacterales bacterium]